MAVCNHLGEATNEEVVNKEVASFFWSSNGGDEIEWIRWWWWLSWEFVMIELWLMKGDKKDLLNLRLWVISFLDFDKHEEAMGIEYENESWWTKTEKFCFYNGMERLFLLNDEIWNLVMRIIYQTPRKIKKTNVWII